MMDYPMPCESCEKPPASQGGSLKDGLSERKPLFDQWGDTRVSQTPRTRHIESHKSGDEKR